MDLSGRPILGGAARQDGCLRPYSCVHPKTQQLSRSSLTCVGRSCSDGGGEAEAGRGVRARHASPGPDGPRQEGAVVAATPVPAQPPQRPAQAAAVRGLEQPRGGEPPGGRRSRGLLSGRTWFGKQGVSWWVVVEEPVVLRCLAYMSED